MSTSAESAPVEVEPGLAAAEAGPRQIAPVGRRLCTVVGNERAGRYVLVGVDDAQGPPPLPGQFYMLATEHGWGDVATGARPYLGRAFSVCRLRAQRLEFLLDDVGPGTHRLEALTPGERVWVVGPLGIGFTAPQTELAVLVGGGIGIAPLVIWRESLEGAEAEVLLGFRDSGFAAAASLLPGASIATDDGSVGHHGLVTELLERTLSSERSASVYACGPPPMLEAVREICVREQVHAELALEREMACGFGACFGCVVRSHEGYRRLCVDGPIVCAADLHEDWM